MTNKWNVFILIVVVFIIAFIFRGFNLDGPPYEQHMFRQTQTMSTILDFSRNGIDLLHPKVNWVGYPGYLVYEFPIFQAIGALIYTKVGTHIAFIRIFNILISLFASVFLYLFAKRHLGVKIAIYSMFFFLMFPLDIIFQRAILIDPLVVFLMIVSFWLIDNVFAASKWWRLYLVLIFITLSIGLPTKALYFLPTFIYLAYYLISNKPKALKSVAMVVVSIISIGFLFAWLRHSNMVNAMYYFSQKDAVLNHIGLSSLLSANYYEQLLWRAMNIILMPLGIALYLISILAIYHNKKSNIAHGFILLITVIPIIYLLLFANINNPHSYYQLPLMPFFAISLAVGLNFLVEKLDQETLIKNLIVTILLSAYMLSSLHVMIVNRYFFQEQNPTIFAEKIKGHIDAGKNIIFFGGLVPDSRLASSYDSGRKYVARGCEYLYAMDSFGMSKTINFVSEGIEYFNLEAPHFNGHLDYVVFYQVGDQNLPNQNYSWLTNVGFNKVYKKDDLLIFKKQ